MTVVFVGIAGALGSMARFVVGRWATSLWGGRIGLPVGTLTVNVLGCLFLGFVMALFASRGALDSKLRIAVTIGFLGGFTTYSTFAFETVGLLEKRHSGLAALYVTTTLLCAGFACFVGLVLGRRL